MSNSLTDLKTITRPSRLMLTCLVLVYQLLLMLSHASAQDRLKNIIVLDGSKSMWGRFGNQRKYKLVASTVETILKHRAGETPIGVMAFGHVRNNSCRNVEVLKKATRFGEEEFSAGIKSYRPRGFAPVSQALEKAATEVNYQNAPARIIMIVDGPDNCRRDPCKTLKTLRENSQDLGVHVIGLNLRERDIKRYKCFKQHPSDALYIVKNKKQLLTALFIATGTKRVAKQDVYKRPKVSEKQISSYLTGASRIKLIAVMSSGSAPLREGISWKIYKVATDRSNRRNPVAQTGKAQPVIPLDPGNYVVETTYGLTKTEAIVTVPQTGALTHVVDLNVGTLVVKTKASTNDPTSTGVSYALYNINSNTNETPVARSSTSPGIFKVKAGVYRIVARQDGHKLENIVTVSPGRAKDVLLEIKTGQLKLSTFVSKGTRLLDGVFYTVYKSRANDLKPGDEITRTAIPEPTLKLPAGRYIIKAEHDLAHTFVHVLVKSGQTTKARINLNAGVLTIDSLVTQKVPILKDRVFYRILSLKPAKTEIARTTSPKKTFILAPGRYRVISRYGSINAVHHVDVNLNPGENRRVTMKHNAGRVMLSLMNKSGKYPKVDVFWTLFDRNNNEIWRTSRPTPDMILKSGKYKVLAESGRERYHHEFVVEKGKRTEIKITEK